MMPQDMEPAGVRPDPSAQAALLAAARNDDRAGIDSALAAGADPRADDSRSLREAAAEGALNAVRRLLEHGADPAARDHEAFRRAAAGGHLGVQADLHEAGHQPDLLDMEARAMLAEMQAELADAAAIYRPSRFWEQFGAANAAWLGWAGLENFKRTINQNYFNFVIRGFRDPRIRRSLALWRRTGWRRAGLAAPLRTRLANPDDDPGLWFSRDPRYRIFPGRSRASRWLKRQLYRLMVGAQFAYAERRDRDGWLRDMEEPALGNPIPLSRDGRRISQDLANSALSAAGVMEALAEAGCTASGNAGPSGPRPTVAELGAGYGRLGWLLLAKRRVRYIVFDIPPALLVAQWYLATLYPDLKLFRFRRFQRFEEVADELAQADIAFFTANQLELWPDGAIDAFVSISALHEMTRPQIAHFLALFDRKTAHAVHLLVKRVYRNPIDGLVVERDAYAMPAGWRLWREVDDPLNPGFFTLSFLREGVR